MNQTANHTQVGMSLNCRLSVQYYSLLSSTHSNIILLIHLHNRRSVVLCTQYPTVFWALWLCSKQLCLHEFVNKKQYCFSLSLTRSPHTHTLSLFIFRSLRLLIYSNEPMNINDNLMTIKNPFVHGRVIIISSMCVHLYELYCVLMILLTSKVTRLVNQTSNK